MLFPSTAIFGSDFGDPTGPAFVGEVLAYMPAPVSGEFDIPAINVSGFSAILVEIQDLQHNDDSGYVALQLYTDSVLRTSGYRYAGRVKVSDGGTDTADSQSSSGIVLTDTGSSDADRVGNGAGESYSATLEISGIRSLYKLILGESVNATSEDSFSRYSGAGLLEDSNNLTGILLYDPSDIGFSSGKVTVYGLVLREGQ